MSGSLNRVTLIGNLGADPEVRSTQEGVKVVSFSLATSEKWTDRNSGEKKERTEWHRVVVWGNREGDGLAGIAEKYLKKGSKCYVEGQLQTSKWQDQSGVDRYTTEVILRGFKADLTLLDGQPNGRPPHPAERESASAKSSPADDPRFDPPGGGAGDSDIPF
jgi:single-strand DNA-binding protein